jgi:GT2 family glycosyltransferase
VFLVDDGSNDGTSRAVMSQFPAVKIIQGTGDLFWNRGMHLAWKTASDHKDFDYYLWLNDDTILFENALETALGDSLQKKDQAIICGTTQSSDLKKNTYGGRTKKDRLLAPQKPLLECETINGNFVLIPKLVYRQVGLIDPIFWHAIGDHDYGFRAMKMGIKSYVASKPIGICDLNDSLPQWCLPENNIRKRFKSLYSPLGNSHPYYYFIFDNRHFGLRSAVTHFFSIHLRALCPRLWK